MRPEELVTRVRVWRKISTLVGLQVTDYMKNFKDFKKRINFFLRSPEVPKNPSDFLYLGEAEPLSFDFFRPKQPNAKTGDQCLVSYLREAFIKKKKDDICHLSGLTPPPNL